MINFNEKYLETIFEKQQPAIFLFTNDEDEDYALAYYEAAKQLEGEIIFVICSL